MKVKRMGITEILRRIWLFSANKIKRVGKQPTQLNVQLNSSLRHISVTNISYVLQYYKITFNLRRSYCFIPAKLQPYLIMGLKIHCFIQFFITFFLIGLINGNPFWDQAPFRSRLELEKSPQLQENKIDWGDQVWFFNNFQSF